MMINGGNAGIGAADEAASPVGQAGLLNRRSFMFGSAIGIGTLSLAGCATSAMNRIFTRIRRQRPMPPHAVFYKYRQFRGAA